MLSAFGNVFKTPDLRKKVLFTLTILAIFRLGSAIPTPNVNLVMIRECVDLSAAGDRAGLYSLINLFSGGALLHLAIFALGIMPYITSSIILQVLATAVPRLEALKKEGSAGQAKITQYTRGLTIVLAVLQATSFTMMAVSGQLFPACPGSVVYDDSLIAIITMILVMVAGTGVIMWMGELITERGIGNGMSILIFTQIAARFPQSMWSIRTNHPGNQGILLFLVVLGVGLLIMLAVLFVEQGQRRIPVQYPKKQVGNRTVGGTTSYIPIKVNQAGVIPVIFASSLMFLPSLYVMFFPEGRGADWVARNLSGQTPSWIYTVVMIVLIIAFAFFYVSITFNPVEISDNMRKAGGFIPGIKAGTPTENYISYVISRMTSVGSLYLSIIWLIPTLAVVYLAADANFPFGGTSILIIVGVGLDTVKQIESQLHQRNYEGFLK